MRVLSPVVWSEGMHLAQHHFQAQGRYFEELTEYALSNLFFQPYGLVRCELDSDALLNGIVSLTHARGIMPDGLPFHFPEDPPPQPLEIAPLFSPVQDSHHVLLAIAPYRPGRANCAVNGTAGNGDVRFTSSEQPMADEITGADEKRIGVARKNFRLSLDGQATADLVTLPIGKIRRDGRGRFKYDTDYIPPSLQIGASLRLLELTSRLVEMLDAKSDKMTAERTASQKPFAEWAAREVANFWLTHAVNSAAAPLRHLLRTRAAHPEQLFLELSRLAGALCTFSLDAHPRDLPMYDHDDLTTCFDVLERHIRTHLEIMMPTNALAVTLEAARDPFFFHGQVADKRAFVAGAHWYLGVHSTASRADVASSVPRLTKICSAEHIVRLVKEGLPGLTLEFEPSPPSALSPRLGWSYFRVQNAGPCWTLMVKTGNVGVYVPAAVPDVELQFTIVLGT